MTLPPLRHRKRDIPILAMHFLKNFNEKNQYVVEGFSEEALKLLTADAWPGNIREINNLIERLVVLKQEGRIEAYDLPRKIRRTADIPLEEPPIKITNKGICLNTAVTEFEKALILPSLQRAKGVKNEAAKLLNLKRTTLVEKIKRYHLDSCDLVTNKYARPHTA